MNEREHARNLIAALEADGVDCASYAPLTDLTVFAVQYRYEAYEEADEPLNRPQMAADLEALLTRVERLLA